MNRRLGLTILAVAVVAGLACRSQLTREIYNSDLPLPASLPAPPPTK